MPTTSTLYTPTYRDIPKASKLAKLTWTPGSLKAPWRDSAECRFQYLAPKRAAGIFTAEYKKDALAEARKLCRACPVALECLTDAVEDSKRGGKPQGVRGGFHFTMGGLDEESRAMMQKVFKVNVKPTPSSH